MHIYQGDTVNSYLINIANKYKIKTLYSWHTMFFKQLIIVIKTSTFLKVF